MNCEPPDSDLKRLFGEQRERDAMRVPSFARLSETRREAAMRLPWLPTALGAAAAVVAIVAGVISHRPQPPLAIDRNEIARIVEWEAPTQFLLEPRWQIASTSE